MKREEILDIMKCVDNTLPMIRGLDCGEYKSVPFNDVSLTRSTTKTLHKAIFRGKSPEEMLRTSCRLSLEASYKQKCGQIVQYSPEALFLIKGSKPTRGIPYDTLRPMIIRDTIYTNNSLTVICGEDSRLVGPFPTGTKAFIRDGMTETSFDKYVLGYSSISIEGCATPLTEDDIFELIASDEMDANSVKDYIKIHQLIYSKELVPVGCSIWDISSGFKGGELVTLLTPHEVDKYHNLCLTYLTKLKAALNVKSSKLPASLIARWELVESLANKLLEKIDADRIAISKNVTKSTFKPVVQPSKKEPTQTKEHIHPKEYPQFVDLVSEHKVNVHDTREAIKMACEDMNRRLVEPATYYKWKEIVEKEREKGSELISEEVAETIKSNIASSTSNISEVISKYQDSLGMDKYLPKSKGEQEAYLEMLKQLDSSIPKIKYLKKSIMKYANRLNITIDDTRLSGRKVAYDYLSELKQTCKGATDTFSESNKEVEVMNRSTSKSTIYCMNKECSSIVDKYNTLCSICEKKKESIDRFETRTCAIESCDATFANRNGEDRLYCTVHMHRRSREVDGEVIVSQEAIKDFVDFLQVYIMEGKAVMESISLAAKSANIQEVDDIDLISKWCKNNGSSYERETVSPSGRIYRSIELKSLFIRCYKDLEENTNLHKNDVRRIVSNILGTPIPSEGLVYNWISNKVDKRSLDSKIVSMQESSSSTSTDKNLQPKVDIGMVSDVLDYIDTYIKTADRESIIQLEAMIAVRKSELRKDLLARKAKFEEEIRKREEAFTKELEELS